MVKRRRRKLRRVTDDKLDKCYVPPQFNVTDDLNGEAKLRETVERELPEFAKMIKEAKVDYVILHQDAFASGYDVKEYILFGMVLKYAGLHKQQVRIIGTPGETC